MIRYGQINYNLLSKKSPDETYTHRGLCQSEEHECKWTHRKYGVTWQFPVRVTKEKIKEKGRVEGK